MPIPRGLTIKEKAYLEAAAAALDTPQLQKYLSRFVPSEREEIFEAFGNATRAVIDNVWTKAHQEGHGCKSPFCKAKG